MGSRWCRRRKAATCQCVSAFPIATRDASAALCRVPTRLPDPIVCLVESRASGLGPGSREPGFEMPAGAHWRGLSLVWPLAAWARAHGAVDKRGETWAG